MTEPVVSCRNVGIWFTRGSRRAILRHVLGKTFFRRRATPTDGDGRCATVEEAAAERLEGDRLWALRHVDLEVPEGARLAVCGANGSGKTTLMRLLTGVYQPDEGELAVRGTSTALLSLGAGISHQISGRENVFLISALYGLSRAEAAERYEEIRDFAELDEGTMSTPVRYYSNGMRTRLGFAIVATLVPDVLLLDEVLAVGDISFRQKSAERLEQLATQARCVIITSHDISFLKRHCDRAIWIHDGRVVESGESDPVLDAYFAFAQAHR